MIPRTEVFPACGYANVKSHWETATFPQGGGLCAIASAIPPADLPAASRQHDASAHQDGASDKLKQETSPCSPRLLLHSLSYPRLLPSLLWLSWLPLRRLRNMLGSRGR